VNWPTTTREYLTKTKSGTLSFEIPDQQSKTYKEKCPCCERILSWRILSAADMRRRLLLAAIGLTSSGAGLLLGGVMCFPRWYAFVLLLYGGMNFFSGVVQLLGKGKPTWGFLLYVDLKRGWPGNVQLVNETLDGHELFLIG
jgi:hypothetical protein